MPRAQRRLSGAEPASFAFDWNGHRIPARSGDTVAAALHAAGVRYLVPSRKFHEPRGLSGSFVAGELAIVDGVPHCRLHRTPARAGARVRMQNVWPSPALDLLRAARLVPRRWLRAGFEHPRWLGDDSALWRAWERSLAFVAGEASAPPERSSAPPAGRRMKAGCVVVGGGAAGVEAAGAAQGDVVLLTRGGIETTPAARVTVLAEHEVFALYDGGRLVAAAPLAPEAPAVLIETEEVILATGSRSVPPLVEGAALPGVLDAASALKLATRHAVPAGNRVVVAGTARGAAVAEALAGAGVEVVEFVAIETLAGIRGRAAVTGIEAGGRLIACDALVHAGPWRPDPSLAFHAAWGGDLRLVAKGTPARVRFAGRAAELAEPVHVGEPLSCAAYVCPCMDVTVEEVLFHVRRGITHIEEIKRLTGCGMGPCQGLPCWELLNALLARVTGEDPEAVGYPTYRPPRAALTFAQAAGLAEVTEVAR